MQTKNFLDVDESIIEKNLRIKSNEEQDFEEFFSGFLNPDSGKLIKPAPGFCIKTFKIDDKSKIFINLCHHAEIPPPEDISQEELIEVLNSKDPERYCVPLSIGTEHNEIDKSNTPVKAFDVAVNSNFFRKCQNNELFQTFIVSATLEGIAEKFKLEISSENPIILKNRKCIGTLQQHRIQKRLPRPSSIKKKPLIQELDSKISCSQLEIHLKPEYKMYQHPEKDPKNLIIDVWLPDINYVLDIDVKCGEDCLILSTKKNPKYELDIFLPCIINQQSAIVTFNTITKTTRHLSLTTHTR
ncbi:PIH1 domain-containing protein 1-like isoform X2 [Daktulosphaira vitifoliae]|uniref:PIH1 domain-containing protein 1-like isoform X2 n=1 Tax=Daktulosphaira vitifoliae TaxID=58002 RepID=UPI0021AA4C63|nr:PIH1 domain-containing protein 1-like isoform X2 [Daktulosphaira vitifoliae]